MELNVYLAGHIHDEWRKELKQKAKAMNLSVNFLSPMENHDRSDYIGEEIIGEQPTPIQRDAVSASINNFRTQLLLEKSDAVIALFGEKFKQWNTAMDASAAISKNKPLILIRPQSLHHPLKELENKAQVTVETIDQALQVLSYVFES
jgi:YtoQ family protein